ncbi:PREDICTED: E3 ubiquitin-protein ligase TRIM71-like [Branchiostoma belcheri]|uniref:E3 ubiquitin-protein ligase TRIM71-like n=1 Tax=Branchiostoma belcheri TaxID=7741 RepID=A0A6P5AD93_BRABE|nr:PREDICTED: E3 ubiquitin-protein ligase TRIM71-like [Branchiostoma belcheri]
MAESKLLSRLSEDFLECQICLQPYRRPKVLSCLHSFCQQCLEEVLKKQKVKTELDCPTCRNTTVLPGGGVAELKDNFFVESLRDTVDVHKKLANEGESLVCGSCEAKSGAESFCTECGDFLCDECVAIHRRIKLAKGHQVIGVEQLRSAESEAVNIKPRLLPPCRLHSQETLKLFCVDCSEAICQLCTVLSHKDHKYEYFTDTAVKAKGEIGALLAKAEKKVSDFKNAGQQAQAQKTQLEKNVTETVEKIKRKAEETRRQLVALVNEQEADLLNSVNTVSQTRSKEFSTAIDEIETATVALESAAEFGRNIVEHGSEFEIMAVSGEVNSRLKKLLGLEIADMTKELPAKAYIAFEEDKTSAMTKPHLGDVKTNEGSGFRTARLTTLGTTGRLGPTSLGTHYGGQDHEGLVQLKDGIQYFTVPDSGQYRIEAAGSAAGWGTSDAKSARGRGAVVRGTFQLKKGEVLKILVGQEGLENRFAGGVGGGGGTFVTKRDNTPLLVAGGAGGGNYMNSRNPNSDGTTAAAGQASSGGDDFTGGSDGKGATHGDDDDVGGGGGGLLTDGASGKTNFGGTDGYDGGEGGKAFVIGGVGGRGVCHNAEGGFGGGGGSLGWGGGGGGGGGYSGGGRGDNTPGACGGGGGSYNAGSDASGEGGANDGPGYVTLTRKV